MVRRQGFAECCCPALGLIIMTLEFADWSPLQGWGRDKCLSDLIELPTGVEYLTLGVAVCRAPGADINSLKWFCILVHVQGTCQTSLWPESPPSMIAVLHARTTLAVMLGHWIQTVAT